MSIQSNNIEMVQQIYFTTCDVVDAVRSGADPRNNEDEVCLDLNFADAMQFIKELALMLEDRLQEEVKEMDSISIGWEIEDVREEARRKGQELTLDESRETLRLAKKNHDASIGINWEVLSIWIDFVINMRGEK